MSVGRVVQEGGGMPTPAAPGGGDDATAGLFSEVAGMDGGRITQERQLCINLTESTRGDTWGGLSCIGILEILPSSTDAVPWL